MTAHILLVPLLTPLLAAMACLFAWKKKQWQQYIYLSGSMITLAGAAALAWQVLQEGIVSIQAGGWEPPFGITLVADAFSVLLVVVTHVLGVLIYFYTLPPVSVSQERKSFGFYPSLLLMLFGITGALLTGDIFNLYVWFEVMLVSSFVLISLGNERLQLEGAVKYVTINFIASALFLAGIAILYGMAGSTNMADLAVRLRADGVSDIVYVAMLFFLVSFSIKAALFPLFFWLPASYPTPPIGIAAIIAGLLTKIGIYALIRTLILVFPDNAFVQQLLLGMAILTMLTGIFGAIAQYDMRKILAFLIVSHMGYMVMGLAIATPLALAGTIFYMVHSILVKTNLFFISGLVFADQQSFHIRKAGGLYERLPWMAALFLISAFSLVGIPPLSGFWGKYMLASTGLATEQYLLVGVALLTSMLTLWAVSRIWLPVFWQHKGAEKQVTLTQGAFVRKNRGMVVSSAALTLLILWLGFQADPIVEISIQAAEQLFDRQAYIDAVLKP